MKTITTFGLICAIAPSQAKTVKKESHKAAKKDETPGAEVEKAAHDLAAAGKKEGHEVYVAGEKAGHKIEEDVKDAEKKTKKFFHENESKSEEGG